MSTTTVAKKRNPPDVQIDVKKGGGRTTAPVQVEKELARMAAVISSHRGITQSELVSPVLRPFLEAQYEVTQQAIQGEIARRRREG